MASQTTFINSLLNAAFRGQTYTGGVIKMHLYTVGVPSGSGVEVTGGSYIAQTLTLSPAASKAVATSANATFTNLPTSTIVAYGIKSGATLIDEGLLNPSFTADTTNNTLSISYSFNLAGS